MDNNLTATPPRLAAREVHVHVSPLSIDHSRQPRLVHA